MKIVEKTNKNIHGYHAINRDLFFNKSDAHIEYDNNLNEAYKNLSFISDKFVNKINNSDFMMDKKY